MAPSEVVRAVPDGPLRGKSVQKRMISGAARLGQVEKARKRGLLR